jgi:hypothetical protein
LRTEQLDVLLFEVRTTDANMLISPSMRLPVLQVLATIEAVSRAVHIDSLIMLRTK